MSDQATLSDNDAGKITRVEELGYELRISQVMTTNVVTFSPDLSMLEALDHMLFKHPIYQRGAGGIFNSLN